MSYNVGGLKLDQPYRIRRIGHLGYFSPDIEGTLSFLTKELGLVESDLEDFSPLVPRLSKADAGGYFLRCGTDHHTVVLGSQRLVDTREPGRKGTLVGQLSWQVGSLQEVVDGVEFLGKDTAIRRIGRDSPGSNWHVYAYDPDGYVNEIFYGMEQIGWDGYSKPQSMYDRAFKSCPPLPQISELQEVAAALERGDSLKGFRSEDESEPGYVVEGVLMSRPFKLTRLGRILIFVEDIDVSVEFYSKVMGLKLTQCTDVLGLRSAFLRADTEHHTLALLPKALEHQLPFGAAYGMAVASYQQLRDAYRYLSERDRLIDVPASLAPGVPYGFWVRGPDRVAIQLYYGMECVDRQGSAPEPVTYPAPVAGWPEAIQHGGCRWFDPVSLGPLA